MNKVDQQLKALRKDIDRLDKLLLKILHERFKLIKKIGKIKLKHKLPVVQKGRWESLLEQRMKLAAKYKLDRLFIKAFMTLIHKESCRVQKDLVGEVKK